MEKTAKEVLTAEYQTALDGQSREFRESGQQLYFVFFLALAFIYLVLSAQFESFRGPLVIMLTVPLAMTGALVVMKLAGVTLNVYSQIGLVMLIGLITKNGILIVEFTNQLRDRGMEMLEALDRGVQPAAAPDPDDERGDRARRRAARGRRLAPARNRARRSAGSSWAACRSARCSRCS